MQCTLGWGEETRHDTLNNSKDWLAKNMLLNSKTEIHYMKWKNNYKKEKLG